MSSKVSIAGNSTGVITGEKSSAEEHNVNGRRLNQCNLDEKRSRKDSVLDHAAKGQGWMCLTWSQSLSWRRSSSGYATTSQYPPTQAIPPSALKSLHSLSCYQTFCAAPKFSPPWDELMTNALLYEAESTSYLTVTTRNCETN